MLKNGSKSLSPAALHLTAHSVCAIIKATCISAVERFSAIFFSDVVEVEIMNCI